MESETRLGYKNTSISARVGQQFNHLTQYHIVDQVVGVLGKPTKVTPFPRHSSALDDRLVTARGALDGWRWMREYLQVLERVSGKNA